MHQKDYLLIVVIAIFSAVVAILFSNAFISTDNNTRQTTEVVESISPEFITPPAQYYNPQSVNPTKLIEISPESTGNPFGQ